MKASEEEILERVVEWIDILVLDDYEAAWSLTRHDERHKWTPGLMREVVAGYGLVGAPQSNHRLSERAIAKGSPEREVVWVRPSRTSGDGAIIAEVAHSLPLDGQWRELTVAFGVCVADGVAFLVLEEIHVF